VEVDCSEIDNEDNEDKVIYYDESVTSGLDLEASIILEDEEEEEEEEEEDEERGGTKIHPVHPELQRCQSGNEKYGAQE